MGVNQFGKQFLDNECDNQVIELLLNRSEISEYIGLTVETVCRTFTKFVKIGMIEIDNHTSVKIVDPNAYKILVNIM